MAEEEQQIHLPSLVIILVLSGLIFRYLFFSPSSNSANNNAGRGRQAADPAAIMRSREQAVERIQQMFPQVDRRTILWDLQRTGGNIAVTTERVLQGRLESVSLFFSLSLFLDVIWELVGILLTMMNNSRQSPFSPLHHRPRRQTDKMATKRAQARRAPLHLSLI